MGGKHKASRRAPTCVGRRFKITGYTRLGGAFCFAGGRKKSMEDSLARTRMLIGEDGIRTLAGASVAVIGLGGVGSFAAEALARCGIGNLTLIDKDTVVASNLNRQLVALHSTLGRLKVEVMKERIHDLNPTIYVQVFPVRYTEETSHAINLEQYDYVVDAIDSVQDKILLLKTCYQKRIRIISCMGTGWRLDPTLLRVADIKETSLCPLARRVRRGLRAVGIESGIKVVYSLEKPCLDQVVTREVGSMVLVPSVAGLMMAAEVVKDILQTEGGICAGDI